MIPELGHYALILALCLAVLQGTVPLVGVQTGRASLVRLARPAALGQWAFIALGFAALAYSFAVNDFSVAYVAANSNTHLPLMYRLTAVWGAHEGSLLLWIFILGCWTAAVALFSRHLPRELQASVLAVMGWVSMGFLLYMLLASNPFARQFPAPLQGRNLDPLLQDPGMISHPPMLYMGYVGFSVAFAFAIAALIGGRLDAAWARWTRPWTTAAWTFLTVGITLGSWWSYRELGWGGWWFWDPVENASFMPWLAGTALIHSLAVTEKRGAFKSWTVLLAICAFSLCLLGTFLVRSGVLVSVHAFSSNPKRGIFILMILGVLVGASLLLYAIRAPYLKSDVEIELFSREGLLLLNNVLLLVAAGAVLLGTLYPIVLSGFNFGKISVGPPYFDAVFAPLFMPLVVLIGFALVVRWHHGGHWRDVVRRLRWPLGLAVAIGTVLPWWGVGASGLAVTSALIMAVWAIMTGLAEPWRRVRHHGAGLSALTRMPRATWGMTFAHVGLGITVIGITLASAYSIRRDVNLKPGQSAEVHGYTFRLEHTTNLQGPDYHGVTTDVWVGRNGHRYALLKAEKRQYVGSQSGSVFTKAAIDWHPTYDLYVALGNQTPDGGWTMRLYYKPFVTWIWYGGLLMGLGGLLAVSDRRYRLAVHAFKRLPMPRFDQLLGSKVG